MYFYSSTSIWINEYKSVTQFDRQLNHREYSALPTYYKIHPLTLPRNNVMVDSELNVTVFAVRKFRKQWDMLTSSSRWFGWFIKGVFVRVITKIGWKIQERRKGYNIGLIWLNNKIGLNKFSQALLNWSTLFSEYCLISI